MEVPLHNGAEGEVNQAAQIPNQPKEANDYLPENKLAKLRRHASLVHFAKIHFGKIHLKINTLLEIHFWKYKL